MVPTPDSVSRPRAAGPGPFTVTVEPGLVEVSGKIDQVVASELQAAFEQALGAERRCVVDLRAVTFLDSYGMQVLYDFTEAADLEVIVGAGSVVARVLEICGLAHVATVRQVDPPGVP